MRGGFGKAVAVKYMLFSSLFAGSNKILKMGVFHRFERVRERLKDESWKYVRLVRDVIQDSKKGKNEKRFHATCE